MLNWKTKKKEVFPNKKEQNLNNLRGGFDLWISHGRNEYMASYRDSNGFLKVNYKTGKADFQNGKEWGFQESRSVVYLGETDYVALGDNYNGMVIADANTFEPIHKLNIPLFGAAHGIYLS